MANNFELWGDMFNAQKQMMDAWGKMVGMGKDGDKSAMPNFGAFFDYSKMEDFYKMQQNMMNGWNDLAKNFMGGEENFLTSPYGAWKAAMENYNPLEASKLLGNTASEVYEKMIKSNSFYLGLYQVWDEINKKMITPASEEFKTNMDEFLSKYDSVLLENFVPLLPEEMRSIVVNPYNYTKTLMKTFTDFYNPWTEAAPELNDIIAQSMLKDPTRVSDYLRLWKKTFDKTYGNLVTSPVVGQSREFVEQNNKAIDSLIDMVVSLSEYMTSIMGIATENSKKAFEDYMDMIQSGEQPKTFHEFFKMWSEKVEKAIEKHFNTEEFSNLIALTADSYMKFKIESDKAIEKYLEQTPIVTKSEVDSVYKNVYELKKEVKALKKQIAELQNPEEKADAAKKTTATAKKTTTDK